MSCSAPFAVRRHDHDSVQVPQPLGQDLDARGVDTVIIRYEYHNLWSPVRNDCFPASRQSSGKKNGPEGIRALLKMVGASRFERPTTRTPNECATRLRHAPMKLFLFRLFENLEVLPDLLLRLLQQVIPVLTAPASQFPLRSRYRISALIKELLDLQDVVQVLLGVKTLAGLPLLRPEMWKLRLPVPQYIRLEARDTADLADAVEQLTRLTELRLLLLLLLWLLTQ